MLDKQCYPSSGQVTGRRYDLSGVGISSKQTQIFSPTLVRYIWADVNTAIVLRCRQKQTLFSGSGFSLVNSGVLHIEWEYEVTF